MIPRRMRRRKPRTRVRHVLQASRPITAEQAKQVQRDWEAWAKSPRLTPLVIEGFELKEIRT